MARAASNTRQVYESGRDEDSLGRLEPMAAFGSGTGWRLAFGSGAEMTDGPSALTRCVQDVVGRIPRGRVTNYGRIARACGRPRAARLVGWLLNAGKDPNTPYHRVVNQSGELTGSSHFGRDGAMQELLATEGVVFLNDGRVDMQACLWEPGGGDFAPPDLDPEW